MPGRIALIRRLARVRSRRRGPDGGGEAGGARHEHGRAAIGVIGGSGLYELEGLNDVRWNRVRTPFGDPSDAYCVGRLGDRRVMFLPRHGRGHRLTPSELNFRANIWGLKSLGVEWVISVRGGRQHARADPPARPRHPRPVLRPHQAARPVVLRGGHRGPRGHGRSGVPGAGRRARDGRRARRRHRAPGRHLHLHRGPPVLDQGRVARSTGAGASTSSA